MNLCSEEKYISRDDLYPNLDVEEVRRNIIGNSELQCPSCRGKSINRNGKTKLKRQRYICKDCGKSFSEMTGSPLSYSKKSIDKWINYIFYMKERLTLRETAKLLKINLTTSFHWRHKILSVIGTKIIDKKLSGIIEVDELKIKENFKGNHRKRYEFFADRAKLENYEFINERCKRDVVSILSCKDSEEIIFFKAVVMGRVTRPVLDEILAPAIRNGKILGTTRNINYINFAKTNKLKLCMVGNSSYLIKGVDINRAKAQSRYFKAFLENFKGVASKYLSYYINWFRAILENSKNMGFDLLSNFITGERQLRAYEFKRVQFNGKLIKETVY